MNGLFIRLIVFSAQNFCINQLNLFVGIVFESSLDTFVRIKRLSNRRMEALSY